MIIYYYTKYILDLHVFCLTMFVNIEEKSESARHDNDAKHADIRVSLGINHQYQLSLALEEIDPIHLGN